jgi:predicted nucleic acid-binding protein
MIVESRVSAGHRELRVHLVGAAFASGKYHEAALTAEIVYLAQRLYAISEHGDRLIAATAVALDLPLITRDT